MIKFSLESSTNLRDLIRKLSVGLGKLVSTVNELNTFVGFRGEWSIVDHGTRVSFTGNAHDQRFDHPSNVSMYLSKVQYDPQNAYDNTTGVNTYRVTQSFDLRSNKDCIGIVRLSVSGSIDYYQLINTLKKRAFDIGGNAIGIYDYEEKRRVYVNQQGYKIETDNIFRPKSQSIIIISYTHFIKHSFFS